MVVDRQRLSRRHLMLGIACAATGIGTTSCGGGKSVGPTTPTTVPSGTPTPPHEQIGLATSATSTGLVFGTSAATWQLDDADYSRLVDTQAGLVLTEDDLLWYRLRPSPRAAFDFSYADALFQRADKHRQRVVGAHLVWDEGAATGGRRKRSTGSPVARPTVNAAQERRAAHVSCSTRSRRPSGDTGTGRRRGSSRTR